MVASLRNIPVLMWNAAADELVPPRPPTCRPRRRSTGSATATSSTSSRGEHLTLAINDQYAPAAEFLGTAKVDRNPPHVTYVADPSLDHADLGFVADHAYWLSGAQHATARARARSTRSRTASAPATRSPPPTQFGAGTLGGGNLGTLAFTRQYKTWGPAPPIAHGRPHRPHGDERLARSRSTRSARASSCNVDLRVTSDGPLTVNLTGCKRTVAGAVTASRG